MQIVFFTMKTQSTTFDEFWKASHEAVELVGDLRSCQTTALVGGDKGVFCFSLKISKTKNQHKTITCEIPRTCNFHF